MTDVRFRAFFLEVFFGKFQVTIFQRRRQIMTLGGIYRVVF